MARTSIDSPVRSRETSPIRAPALPISPPGVPMGRTSAVGSRSTPTDMPNVTRTASQGPRAGRVGLPPSASAAHLASTSRTQDISLRPLQAASTGSSTAPGQPESAAGRATREAQEAGQAAVIRYAEANKPGSYHAISQASVVLGINAGTTFGAADTSGREGVADLIGKYSSHIRDLLGDPRNLTSIGAQVAGKMAQMAPGVMAGAALAGIGSIAAQIVLAPAVLGIMQSVAGQKSVFKPVPAEHLVPDPDPAHHDSPESLAAARADVARQRAEIREIQSHYAIDGRVGIGSGIVAFDAAHAGRAGGVRHTDPSASLGARTAYGTAASGGAGMVTNGMLSAAQALVTHPVRVGGEPQSLPLFEAAAAPAKLSDIADNVTGNVSAAMKLFNPHGLEGTALLTHFAKQWGLRSGGVALATLPGLGTAAAATAANAALGEDQVVLKGLVDALTTAVAFTPAVGIWFTVLPKIIKAQAARAPARVGEA